MEQSYILIMSQDCVHLSKLIELDTVKSDFLTHVNYASIFLNEAILKSPRASGCLHLGVRGVMSDASLGFSHEAWMGGALSGTVCVGGSQKGLPWSLSTGLLGQGQEGSSGES